MGRPGGGIKKNPGVPAAYAGNPGLGWKPLRFACLRRARGSSAAQRFRFASRSLIWLWFFPGSTPALLIHPYHRHRRPHHHCRWWWRGYGPRWFKLTLYARTHFFLLLGFCDQIIFYGHCPIFFPGKNFYIEVSAYQLLNGFHHYLSFLTPCPHHS